MKRAAGLVGLIVLLTTVAADARVTRIDISKREPFVGGQPFGTAGAYERLIGRFHGELDPAHALNAGIVDLDRAPRNARGMVEYSSDFEILKPAELSRGNGALLYDVNNRGNKRALIQFNNAPASNNPISPDHAGNGFLMRYGFTVVWSGWIPGLPAANDALRIDVPIAGAAGGPIEQTVWDEFLFNVDGAMQGRLSFRATDLREATLLVRAHNAEEPTIVPRDQWEFVDAQTIRLKPAAPFRMSAIYQLVYKAANPPVAGIGFAATRDLVSFLRYAAADDMGTANPLAPGGRPAVDRALAHGTSQSGRYLRDFVYRGFNEDESSRIVFEGINPHVATARLFLNHRFAQPNRMVHIAHGFMFFPDVNFPFAYEFADRSVQRHKRRHPCPLHGARKLSEGDSHQHRHRILAVGTVADHHRPARQPRRRRPGNGPHLSFRRHAARRNPDHAEGRLRHPVQHRRLPPAAARDAHRARPLGKERHCTAAEPASAHRRRLPGRR